jgi:competence protein ComEA
MLPALREVLSRAAARAIGSPFAKPIARVALAAAGLLLLALIGRSAIAGAGGIGGTTAAATAVPVSDGAAPTSAPPAPQPPLPSMPRPQTSAAGSTEAVGPPEAVAATEAANVPRGHASPDDPVVLNTASLEDLRRLPGVGEKRAAAILALRARLGRLHAIEDLLKVKGIGRATLKRLRPLVRLEPRPPPLDAGDAVPR